MTTRRRRRRLDRNETNMFSTQKKIFFSTQKKNIFFYSEEKHFFYSEEKAESLSSVTTVRHWAACRYCETKVLWRKVFWLEVFWTPPIKSQHWRRVFLHQTESSCLFNSVGSWQFNSVVRLFCIKQLSVQLSWQEKQQKTLVPPLSGKPGWKGFDQLCGGQD